MVGLSDSECEFLIQLKGVLTLNTCFSSVLHLSLLSMRMSFVLHCLEWLDFKNIRAGLLCLEAL